MAIQTRHRCGRRQLTGPLCTADRGGERCTEGSSAEVSGHSTGTLTFRERSSAHASTSGTPGICAGNGRGYDLPRSRRTLYSSQYVECSAADDVLLLPRGSPVLNTLVGAAFLVTVGRAVRSALSSRKSRAALRSSRRPLPASLPAAAFDVRLLGGGVPAATSVAPAMVRQTCLLLSVGCNFQLVQHPLCECCRAVARQYRDSSFSR